MNINNVQVDEKHIPGSIAFLTKHIFCCKLAVYQHNLYETELFEVIKVLSQV